MAMVLFWVLTLGDWDWKWTFILTLKSCWWVVGGGAFGLEHSPEVGPAKFFFWIFCMKMVKYYQINDLTLISPLGCSKKHHFVRSLILANFKDFNVEASFLGPMAIVIPFWKPLAITFQMPPSYRPLKQWLNSNWAKTGKKCNFSVYTWIFFPSVANYHIRQIFWTPEEKLMEIDLEHWNF